MLSDSRERLQEAQNYLKARQDVAFAYLFGSAALDRATPLSDIDIAVYLNEQEFANKRLEILVDLMDVLKTNKLDLVILNTAPITLKMKIVQTGRILAENRPWVRHAFESRTMRSFFDFSKLEKRILENRYLND